MKQKFFLLLLIGIFTASASFSQMSTNRVVVANGGAYSDPDDFVTLTAFDLSTGENHHLATIFTQSVQGLLVHEGLAWVAAQDSLAVVDLNTGNRLAVVELAGVNKFALWQDQLLVSRQYPVTGDFVQVRDAATLELIKSFPEVSDESWEITVAADTAYVSVAGGWAATEGKLAVIDLNSMSFVREMNLGEETVGIGPSYMLNEHLVFVCKTPWGGTTGTLIRYEMATAAYEIFQVPHALAESAGIIDNMLYLQMGGNIGTVNTETFAVADAALIENPYSDLEITGMALDSTGQQLFVNYSYWVAPDGTGKIYDLQGNETGEYQVGIAAEEVAVDYREITGLDENRAEAGINVFPNPCHDHVNIRSGSESVFSVVDIYGNDVMRLVAHPGAKNVFDVSSLVPGMYFIVNQNSGSFHESIKLIKQ